ncbi:MAG: 2-(1,2-epoxy-1,2-dihydrophenyl)acetyl-CoA isomerase [Flavobacteriales bacterium]|jgi:2-(1,2-epoxy-1,2-dihydrophenyl)acetyl-CoA isomerase|nr:2-(1,2-epoxy-1,2-dihydrophenyl)acetyl-CoA isomerase [Flavobacteriales bacterium]MBT6014297.1 2-(1,2-epoxy-1,2-dihydrophenyl)acetyl-CoA isomerase [Flavobacteriales bacterium]MBT7480903.1 2-(1,2-epoxy-1,2-dihydrophenyl)acetyl-CoA isomerase [Flavobacteriales bacterium]
MIKYELIDGVGKITLNRPEKYHSFVREMALKLQNTLDKCNVDKQVRAILITATGKAFCAGQDLGEATDPNGPDLTQIVQEHYNPIIRKIRDIEKPVVVAVNGVAAGAGASIALCCDIVVAAESASFIQAFSKIGLIPDSAGTFFLPRLVGMQKATALMMTAEAVSAKDAVDMGMIYKVFSDENFEDESWKLVSKLAKMPTKGLGLTKRLLNASFSNNLEQQLELENQCQTIAGNTEDFKEGVKAFLEKRKANFKGE